MRPEPEELGGADARHREPRPYARALEEAGVQGDTADRRRCDDLHERAGDLSHHRPPEPDPLRHEAQQAHRRRQIAERGEQHRGRHPLPVRLADRRQRRTGDLREQEVGGDRARDQTDQGPRLDPLQTDRFRRRLRTDEQDLLPDLGQQVLLPGLVERRVEGPLLGLLVRLLLGLRLAPYGRAVRGGLGGLGLRQLPLVLGRLRGRQHGLAFARGPLPGQSPQRRARGAAQRDRLEQRQTVGDGVRAEDLDGRGDRPLGPDP